MIISGSAALGAWTSLRSTVVVVLTCMQIEQIQPDHKNSFIEWMKEDVDSFSFIRKSVPLASSESELFSGLLENLTQERYWVWVMLNGDGAIKGYAELKGTPKVGSAELELIYVIERNSRCIGLGTRLVSEIVAGLSPEYCKFIVAYINPKNVPSVKVLTRCDFYRATSAFGGLKYVRSVHT